MKVIPEHRRLFRRMLEMLTKSGVLEESEDGYGFVVVSGSADPLPEGLPGGPEGVGSPRSAHGGASGLSGGPEGIGSPRSAHGEASGLPGGPEGIAARMAGLYSHGLTEIGLFRRSGEALADVLLGRADPLTLLFSSGEPTAADLYLKAPVARAANSMLRDAVRTLLARLPEGRRLRVIEVGAGTGSATASVLPELPAERFDYTYTDISAGFFAEAEARFGDWAGSIDYRPLDIEKDPGAQGFTSHCYDLVIASNVLHATRRLDETLGHCLSLLAPSGQLVALENLRGLGWMDLTFGQLDGWWRFADAYRPHHALAAPDVWRQALGDAGFEEAEVLGTDDSFSHEMLDKGVIVAQGPAQVTEPPGVWLLTAGNAGTSRELAADLAAELQERNQTVVLATSSADKREAVEKGEPAAACHGVIKASLDVECRDSWRRLMEGLPRDVPFNGVVHLQALSGHGAGATTVEMAEDVRRVGASALALVQGVAESDAAPAKGVWFFTKGGAGFGA